MSVISFENIYYLGPDGSNTYNAMIKALKFCDIKVKNKIPQKSIKAALKCLESDNSSVCVLPIENSIEGIVRETIDNLIMLKDKNIQITGEITLPILHLLLSKNKNIKEIKTIISHPQALAQCSNNIFQNYPDIELKEVSSTSYAAQKVAESENTTLAAIANESCAKIFKLNILEKNINDEKDNKTRFYILSRNKSSKNGNGKTAIILSTPNYAGALCDVLKILSKHNINLTYIDSRPSKKQLGEYMFFMELEGYDEDTKIKDALKELKSIVKFIRVLGSFNQITQS